jgi:hypothetical protein
LPGSNLTIIPILRGKKQRRFAKRDAFLRPTRLGACGNGRGNAWGNIKL